MGHFLLLQFKVKEANISHSSLHTQQCTIHERESVKHGVIPKSFCPRVNVIKNLNQIILDLQKKNHAIILMVYTNQTPNECYHSKKLNPFTIKWLRVQRGMEDPFVQCVNSRPNPTTLTPNRDIDYILTNGIKIPSIPTLHPNNPAHSDHLGIVFDVDLSSYFYVEFQ